MAAKPRKKDPRTDADASVKEERKKREDAAEREDNSRGRELCGEKEIRDACLDVYKDVLQGFTSQAERSDTAMDYWDVYNCKLGPLQAYVGNSKIYVPIVHNAVEARKTRFTNQIFPQSGRYVECVSSEDKPTSVISLLEHYIRKAKLRSRVIPSLMKNGDIEGQYSLYLSWDTTKRTVMWRTQKPLEDEQGAIEGTDGEDMHEETVERGLPRVEVLADADLCVLPETVDSVDRAIDIGGSVSIIRRWSKAQVNKMIADGEFDADAGKAMLERFSSGGTKSMTDTDKEKSMVDAAGIKTTGGRTFAQGYETWTMLTYEGERRIYRVYFGGEDLVLGCKRNPYWCDRVPVLSAPVDKVQGSFKGIPKVQPCATLQYAANDAVNEGMDSATYSLLPIIMTDPQKNPRIGTMVLNLAAIWETNPNDTQFAKFPELWRSAFDIVNANRTEIFQTLSVTPSMMPQSTSMRAKRNQAEIAQEQQVDILSTADAVGSIEESILTPMLLWFVELDHQYRTKDITVRQFGQMGVKADMQLIKPVQMDKRYEFRWYGVEAARNAQQIQQQIAAVNVVRGIPEQLYAPYKLNVQPFLSLLIENTFGPRLAPEIFVDPRSQLTQDPRLENEMLADGFDLPAHPLDDDAQHLEAHKMLMQDGDPTGVVRLHIQKHIQQLSMKTMQQQQQAQGAPGVPGGAGPGVAGSPRSGAQPGMPRGGQQPPGAIHLDRMQGAGIAPRR